MALRPADENDAVYKLFARNDPILEKIPEPDYVTTYGCGQGAVLRPDGSWERFESHVDGCDHQEA